MKLYKTSRKFQNILNFFCVVYVRTVWLLPISMISVLTFFNFTIFAGFSSRE